MRLIRLRIRNIASLKGEHEIDFQDIQRESPLFAITGETGAGKSTVLNCIGLALYGQIYKKNVSQPDVVTLGEKEGSIELLFQVKGKFYLADWRIRVRKQNGEAYAVTPTAVRNLYTIEGTEFGDPKNIASTNATELLNLDFDQFCKCIILNQGEFARFLSSSFNDRKEILEKLYPGELLDNISRELDQEKKALEKAKHDIEIELHTLRGDNQSGEELKTEKNGLEALLKKSEEHFKHFEKLDYHFVSLFSYFEKHQENERRKSQVKEEMALETTKYNHLLKASEELSEIFQKTKKQQEEEIPVLQTYLEKEGTLKLLEEGKSELTQKIGVLKKTLESLELKIQEKDSEERESSKKLTTLTGDISVPVEGIKKSLSEIEELFDLFNEKELLSEEIKGKKEKLSEMETKGLELKSEIEEISGAISKLPANAAQLEADIKAKKQELQAAADKKQRALIASEELKKQIEGINSEVISIDEKITSLSHLVTKTEEDLIPIETTLKLQEVLNATEVCVNHAITSVSDTCPVCENTVPESRWEELKKKLASTDLNSMKRRFDEGKALIMRTSQEISHLKERKEKNNKELGLKSKEFSLHEEALKLELPSSGELDKELEKVRIQALELNQFTKNFEAKSVEREKLRQQFKTVRDELTEREKSFTIKNNRLSDLAEKLTEILPEVNRDTIRTLKLDVRNTKVYCDEEVRLQKIQREKQFLNEKKTDSTKEFQDLSQAERSHSERIAEIKQELHAALKGDKASVLIQKINDLVKDATAKWTKHLEEQNRQEQVIKSSQGKLYTLDELTKDIDLQFTREFHTVRGLGEFSAESLVLDKIKNLELNLKSPKELFIPLRDLIRSEKEESKLRTDDVRMQFASVSTKLSAWEKLQDKILLLELKARDINTALERKLRLFEVLGKDELRTFVLSLVEESLIHQTNEELQKLCQGRYEIVHQTKSMKMAPEFFILDKFREGGRRKVSTLSGGETFMVSIAMALGLAEMTRGQAEIDSLFIDEGFGTLDQDSLEDVLDMLQQIQTRGLMVGIISHIKPLTSALAVNLVLNKKSDGTSTVSIQRN